MRKHKNENKWTLEIMVEIMVERSQAPTRQTGKEWRVENMVRMKSVTRRVRHVGVRHAGCGMWGKRVQ